MTGFLESTIRARLAAAIGAAMLVAIVATALWGWRVDTLRGRYRALLDGVVLVLEPKLGRVKYPDIPGAVTGVLEEGEKLRRERDNARAVVKAQSDSITAYEAETQRLTRLSEENRKLAEAVIRERDTWIRRARSAETRTERLSAEQELEECNAVLDALYREGF